jgi:hypothetical protein
LIYINCADTLCLPTVHFPFEKTGASNANFEMRSTERTAFDRLSGGDPGVHPRGNNLNSSAQGEKKAGTLIEVSVVDPRDSVSCGVEESR